MSDRFAATTLENAKHYKAGHPYPFDGYRIITESGQTVCIVLGIHNLRYDDDDEETEICFEWFECDSNGNRI